MSLNINKYRYLYLIILFIHSSFCFILPPKINSLYLIKDKYKYRSINTYNYMKKNNDNNHNDKNKTKIYKIIFDNDNLNDNYEDNETLFIRLVNYCFISFYLYLIIILSLSK